MKTAAEYREEAKAHVKAESDSFDRCDTDGFVSQWCSGWSGRLANVKAAILDAGGTEEFVGLYEGDRRVKAKMVKVYNKFKFANELKWVVDDADPIAAERKWIPCGGRSRIQKKLGLTERREVAKAWAAMGGSGTGMSGLTSLYVDVYRTGDPWGQDAVLAPPYTEEK